MITVTSDFTPYTEAHDDEHFLYSSVNCTANLNTSFLKQCREKPTTVKQVNKLSVTGYL